MGILWVVVLGILVVLIASVVRNSADSTGSLRNQDADRKFNGRRNYSRDNYRRSRNDYNAQQDFDDDLDDRFFDDF